MQHVITDDLEALLATLPPGIHDAVNRLDNRSDLLEIVMDLGRQAEGRFPDGEVILSTQPVTYADLEYVVERIGEFGDDNRAGIERTLHRISAMRNRKGKIVGLTCRIGRAVLGSIALIRDIVEQGQSILILGRPGVGKTTLLREIARVLADEANKRVVVVDTSNEIAGDGDIPHPGIGRARRMQVARTAEQHAVMIEAVENHMPEVIVIDEIGTELEAAAARTIAERGVQLVATAHGNTLENLMMNPTLSDLVGGIESVTLSDEEARRRGTQKSVLERKAPPTFDVLIEIQDRQRMIIHNDVAAAVDALLRGRALAPELRYMNDNGELHVERATDYGASSQMGDGKENGQRRQQRGREWSNGRGQQAPSLLERKFGDAEPSWDEADDFQPESFNRPEAPVSPKPITQSEGQERNLVRVYPYGIGQNRLRTAASTLNVPIQIVDNLNQADVVMTLKNYYRQQPQPILDAERRNVPVYILR